MYSSYESYLHNKWPPKSEIKPLDFEAGISLQLPSDNIYYNLYPYKVKMAPWKSPWKGDYFKEQREKILRRLMFEEFCSNECKAGHRIIMRSDNTLLYFRKYEDFCLFTNFFEEEIHSVYGPINDHHVDLLTQVDTHCAIRKPYFKKYDCKVFVCYKWNSMNLSVVGTRSERLAKIKNAMDFIEENIDPEHYRRANSYYRTEDFYTTYSELSNISPFITLQYPELRMIITRCLFK